MAGDISVRDRSGIPSKGWSATIVRFCLRAGRADRRSGSNVCCGSAFCSRINLGNPDAEYLRCQGRCNVLLGSILAKSCYRIQPRSASFATCRRETSWVTSCPGGEHVPAGECIYDFQWYDHGCHDHSLAALDQKRRWEVRPGRKPDKEGKSIVFRHGDAHRGR